jgi:hypothetical protein
VAVFVRRIVIVIVRHEAGLCGEERDRGGRWEALVVDRATGGRTGN